jgi:hypothetical protein
VAVIGLITLEAGGISAPNAAIQAPRVAAVPGSQLRIKLYNGPGNGEDSAVPG